MSTNASATTEHYGLSQWAEDDLILRQDFNHDNAAIDAALHAQQTAATTAIAALEESVSLVRLASQTLAANADSISISLSGIDMSKFMELQLISSPMILSGSARVWVRFNGDSGENYWNEGVSSETTCLLMEPNSPPKQAGEMTLWTDGSRVAGLYSGVVVNGSVRRGEARSWSGGTLSDLTSIQLTCANSKSFAAGTRITLYGLKK